MKKNKNQGKVYLVGAGPGDAGLITLRGASLLQEADVIVYDRLVNPELLELTQAKKMYAGKTRSAYGESVTGKHKHVPQNRINRLLVDLARKGQKVIRLKGGDPFIFGRGGEEASYLKQKNIPFEVVPGVTAGYSAAAYAGIPVTDRRLASAVVFVTSHEDPRKKESSVDWKKLASLKATLVSYMGIQNLHAVVGALQDGGMSAQTLISVIEWGTLSRQRVVMGTLQTIVQEVRRQKIQSPAIAVIGEVNQFRKRLAWFEKKPLSGKTVLLTRPKAQVSALRQLLLKEGAEVLEFPAIQILPPCSYAGLDRALQNIRNFDWILFTSTNGVEFFFKRLHEKKKDSRVLTGVKIAAIGHATSSYLEERGILADLIPDSFTSEALVRELKKRGQIYGRHFLLPRTDIAPETLRRQLEAAGGCVTDVVAYRTVSNESDKKNLKRLMAKKKIDYITFTSSSTVRNFLEALPQSGKKSIKSRLVSIGPVTSRTLKEFGFKPYKEAKEHTVPGLVETLVQIKK